MLAVGPFGLGPFELLLILAIVVLIFGVGKMSDIGGAMGKSIREFRRAAKEPDELPSETTVESATVESATVESSTVDAPQATSIACTKCSAQVAPGTKFCAECGTSIQATVS